MGRRIANLLIVLVVVVGGIWFVGFLKAPKPGHVLDEALAVGRTADTDGH